MRIGVIGAGYVGLVTGACLADHGHNVICIDIDPQKVDAVNKKMSPFYEKGFAALLKRNEIAATTEYTQAISNAQIIFICVGTPTKKDNTQDLTYIQNACEQIGKNLQNNQTIVVKSLIEHGAEINIRDKKHKMTPLDRAVSMGHVEMVKLLINNGADAMNEALRLSIVHKNVRIAEMFLKNGVDINHMNEDGDTALHCATKWSNIDTVQLLLNYGANVNIENNDGKTPLYYVRGSAFQHKEISDLLIRHGAKE